MVPLTGFNADQKQAPSIVEYLIRRKRQKKDTDETTMRLYKNSTKHFNSSIREFRKDRSDRRRVSRVRGAIPENAAMHHSQQKHTGQKCLTNVMLKSSKRSGSNERDRDSAALGGEIKDFINYLIRKDDVGADVPPGWGAGRTMANKDGVTFGEKVLSGGLSLHSSVGGVPGTMSVYAFAPNPHMFLKDEASDRMQRLQSSERPARSRQEYSSAGPLKARLQHRDQENIYGRRGSASRERRLGKSVCDKEYLER